MKTQSKNKGKIKTKTSNKFFKELVPSILPLIKTKTNNNNKPRHTRPSHAGIIDLLSDLLKKRNEQKIMKD